MTAQSVPPPNPGSPGPSQQPLAPHAPKLDTFWQKFKFCVQWTGWYLISKRAEDVFLRRHGLDALPKTLLSYRTVFAHGHRLNTCIDTLKAIRASENSFCRLLATPGNPYTEHFLLWFAQKGYVLDKDDLATRAAYFFTHHEVVRRDDGTLEDRGTEADKCLKHWNPQAVTSEFKILEAQNAVFKNSVNPQDKAGEFWAFLRDLRGPSTRIGEQTFPFQSGSGWNVGLFRSAVSELQKLGLTFEYHVEAQQIGKVTQYVVVAGAGQNAEGVTDATPLSGAKCSIKYQNRDVSRAFEYIFSLVAANSLPQIINCLGIKQLGMTLDNPSAQLTTFESHNGKIRVIKDNYYFLSPDDALKMMPLATLRQVGFTDTPAYTASRDAGRLQFHCSCVVEFDLSQDPDKLPDQFVVGGNFVQWQFHALTPLKTLTDCRQPTATI